MTINRKTIETLAKAGIELIGYVDVPGGSQMNVLQPEEVEDFLEDRAAWFAKKNEATTEEYLLWLETDGLPRCGAITKRGKRCRNAVSGGSQREFADWLQEDAGFCTVHGGLSREEALKIRKRRLS